MPNSLTDEQFSTLQQLVAMDDRDGVEELLEGLQQAKHDELFQEVGRLTRSLYDAINSLTDEVQGQSRVDEASDSLSYVIKATQTAADNVLDAVDEAQPFATRLQQRSEELKARWDKLGARQLSVAEFKELYGEVGEFLGKTVEDSNNLNTQLQNIVMAQDFQDLTGQVLQRVITMIREVEQGLVALMSHAASVDSKLGNETSTAKKDPCEADMAKGVGPQISQGSGVVSSQDDVDDLLSSLGF